jgi:hypothetical protein
MCCYRLQLEWAWKRIVDEKLYSVIYIDVEILWTSFKQPWSEFMQRRGQYVMVEQWRPFVCKSVQVKAACFKANLLAHNGNNNYCLLL